MHLRLFPTRQSRRVAPLIEYFSAFNSDSGYGGLHFELVEGEDYRLFAFFQAILPGVGLEVLSTLPQARSDTEKASLRDVRYWLGLTTCRSGSEPVGRFRQPHENRC